MDSLLQRSSAYFWTADLIVAEWSILIQVHWHPFLCWVTLTPSSLSFRNEFSQTSLFNGSYWISAARLRSVTKEKRPPMICCIIHYSSPSFLKSDHIILSKYVTLGMTSPFVTSPDTRMGINSFSWWILKSINWDSVCRLRNEIGILVEHDIKLYHVFGRGIKETVIRNYY